MVNPVIRYQPPTPPYDRDYSKNSLLTKFSNKTKIDTNGTSPAWNWLPNTAWDSLLPLLTFNSRIQVSLVCRNWRRQTRNCLWRNPSRRWYQDILRRQQFLPSITEHCYSILKFDSIPICPNLLFSAISLCYNLEALVLNCSLPYIWEDRSLIKILSIPHLARSLKHLVLYDVSPGFTSWSELTSALSKLRALTLITLPLHFPYHLHFSSLPPSLRFLTCSVNQVSLESLLTTSLHQYLGLSLKFDLSQPETSIGKLLLKFRKLTTLSLEGTGSLSDINYLPFPRLLTGLKIQLNCRREDLQNLLRKCRSLEHVELYHNCCDDRVLRLLVRHNRKLSVLKLKNSSVTTVGITSLFRSKSPRLQQLDLESQTDHCGPYTMELTKCIFLNKLTHLRLCLTLYTTLKILHALKHMTSLVTLDVTLHPQQLGSLDCQSLFSPTPPYLAFFPVMTQLDHFFITWPHCFNFTSPLLTSFTFQLQGNSTLLTPYRSTLQSLFTNSLTNFPCLLHPLLLFNELVLYPPPLHPLP